MEKTAPPSVLEGIDRCLKGLIQTASRDADVKRLTGRLKKYCHHLFTFLPFKPIATPFKQMPTSIIMPVTTSIRFRWVKAYDSLKFLSCKHNIIKDAEVFFQLPRLVLLSLADNSIQDVPPLSKWSGSLTFVDLRRNLIADLSFLEGGDDEKAKKASAFGSVVMLVAKPYLRKRFERSAKTELLIVGTGKNS